MKQGATVTPLEGEAEQSGPVWGARGVALSLVLMAMAVVVCRDAWLDIARIVQKDEEASHILLVPLVVARLVWVRRSELKGWQAQASWWGSLIALAGVLLWLVGHVKAMQVVWHFGAIVTVVGAFVCINGLGIVRRLWPAFLVLLFLMPMPGQIRHPLALFLQNISAQATEIVIVAIGFDLVRQTNLLVINDYPVGIAEACNGMRMVSMLLLVVFAFVFSEKIRPWVQLLLVGLSIPLAILCNIIRLVPTVLAYGYFSPEVADQLHDWLGWVMVVLSYFMLVGVLALMRWLLLPVEPGAQFYRPRRSKRRWAWDAPEGGSRGRLPVTLLTLFVVLGAGYGVGRSLPDGSEAVEYHVRVKEVADALPREVAGWTAVDAELPEAAVDLLRPNALISRLFVEEQSGRSFSLLVVQCADARDMEGHYPPNCYPSSGWKSLGSRVVDLNLGEVNAVSMDYLFERGLPGQAESIGVVNVIVVPEGGFVTSMSRIRSLAGTVSDRYYGAAQVQFVFDGRWPLEERVAVVEQVGVILEPLIRVILDKKGEIGGS